MTAISKFRIDAPHLHPSLPGKCSRCNQPSRHVLVISFDAAHPRYRTRHKSSLCSECLQKMLMEDSPIAAAAIAQLFEERNSRQYSESRQDSATERTA
jgi:hypothetical protein